MKIAAMASSIYLKMFVKLLRAICFMAALTAFAIGLLIVVDAFVPRSKPVSYVFHVCEFIAGLLLTMFAQRVLVRQFSSRHEKPDGNKCARQFGCHFAAVVLVVSLTSAAALILCASFGILGTRSGAVAGWAEF